MRPCLSAFVVLLACPGMALAQTASAGGPDLSQVRVRIGPLYLNPSLSLTNIGVDTNVFNEPDQLEPKSDFTFTVTPAAEAWLRFGRTWFTGNVKEDIVWYKKYESERSGNTSYSAGWLAPLNRLTVNVTGSWLSSRERPGFEIDARSKRHEQAYAASVEVRVLARTLFGVRGERRLVDFAEDEVFLGNNLRVELNRAVTTEAFTMRHELTPLTSLTFSAGRERQEFDFSPERDSTSTQMQAGVTFDPAALITGSATFGYRDFKPVDPAVPGFQGSTMSVSLTYVAGGATQLTVTGTRDVEYSFELDSPYYIQSGGSVQLAQQIYGPVEVVGRYGNRRLAYRERGASIDGPVSRTDRVQTYGGGFGYHLSRSMRLGLDFDNQTRSSPLDGRRYNGLRVGGSVTYGL